MSDELRKRVSELEADLAYYKTHFEECREDMLAWMKKAEELQARVAELEEVERKAIEQSEYIQSHGLTEYEMARLKARMAELEHNQDGDFWMKEYTKMLQQTTWRMRRRRRDTLRLGYRGRFGRVPIRRAAHVVDDSGVEDRRRE